MEMNLENKLMKLVVEVKADMDKYGIPYDENTTFSINGRLSRALGRCCYLRNENRTRIEIQKSIWSLVNFKKSKIQFVMN